MPDPGHRSVLLKEALDALALRPGGTYVDATFGAGGHAALLAGELGGRGKLIAMGKDADGNVTGSMQSR